MNEFRLGEDLWMEWDGEGFETDADIVYYTYEHVDTNIEVVQRALACALQRDGIVENLRDGFRVQDNCGTVLGYVGRFWDEAEDTMFCAHNGDTIFGDTLDTWSAATFIEIFL